MKIKERPEFFNKSAVFCLKKSDFVASAIDVMAERNIGSVIIVDQDNKVNGIVTERDLLRRVLAKNLDPRSTPLSAIMTSDIRAARPEDNVIDWLRIMSNERFRHLPVIDDGGRLINVMSQGDFVSYTWPDLLDHLKIKASETLKGPAAPLPILIGGIMLYSLLMVAALKLF
ncbi:MAG: CBS domain-containing protein [Methylocystis sp.]